MAACFIPYITRLILTFMQPLDTLSSILYRILISSDKYLYGIQIYSDVSMVEHQKSFSSQLMNLALSFQYKITVFTKSLFSNIEAAVTQRQAHNLVCLLVLPNLICTDPFSEVGNLIKSLQS